MIPIARHFRHDDQGYLKWIAQNSEGYVLNLGVPPNRNYLMLHKATCGDIRNPSSLRGPAQFTGGKYAKLCALNHEAITNWVKENVPGTISFTHLCQRCGPDVPWDQAANVHNEFASKVKLAQRDDSNVRLARLAAKANRKPKVRYVMARVFDRDPDVVAEVLIRANGKCEGCGATGPFTRKANGEPYLEVHHIVPLAENGYDIVENAVALCPNCHRHRHFGMEPWNNGD